MLNLLVNRRHNFGADNARLPSYYILQGQYVVPGNLLVSITVNLDDGRNI